MLLVDLDGTAGYGTSFLEEAFGGLVRVNRLSLGIVTKHLEIKSQEETYLMDDIAQYMKDAHDES